MAPISTPICRIVVVASNLPRLTKILSLLQEQPSEHDDNNPPHPVLQYLPCVAQFDRYRHEKEWITYLVNVEYHPELIEDALLPASNSLLELANITTKTNDDDDDVPGFAAISDIVVGNGVDTDICTTHIQSYFQTLFSIEDTIPVHCMEPTLSYTNISEELQAFQALSLEDKETATQKGTMGPGKMVHLIRSVGQKRIQEWRDRLFEQQQRQLEAEQERLLQEKQALEEQEAEEEHIIDPSKVRYACRICRNILFGQDDLIEHQAKATTTDTTTKNCQSYFLHQSLPWMQPQSSSNTTNTNTTNLDNDLRETLGRLICQKCQAKLGTWNWSGTPCSCGAWVVPAFQFPKSKVDVVPPLAVANSTMTGGASSLLTNNEV